MERKDENSFWMDRLASGKVPDRLIDEMRRKKVSVDELVQWEESKPPISVSFTDHHIFVGANLCLDTRKFFGILGGFVTVLWFLITHFSDIYKLTLSLLALAGLGNGLL